MVDNVILIVIDALRADHLGCYGYSRNTSPNMDRLAKEGILFKNAIANAPYTTASITSLQTSTYPLVQEETYIHPNKRTSLSEILNKKGFSTIGIHSNPWFSIYKYGVGFNKFVDPLLLTAKPQKRFFDNIKKTALKYIDEDSVTYSIVKQVINFKEKDSMFFPYAKAEEINNTVYSSLNEYLNKFYLWIHYMDVHEPYMPEKFYFGKEIENEEIKRLNTKTTEDPHSVSSQERDIIVDLYDNEIRYVDNKIGELLENLELLCDLKNTIVIITADHGQMLGERGYFGHCGKNTPISFFDEMIRVPLIIWSKSEEILGIISNSQEIEKQIGLIDIAPTVLDVLGIDKPSEFMGESLLSRVSEKPVISQGIQCSDPNWKKYLEGGEKIHCFRTDHYKLICKGGDMELYDLKKDPMELTDISSENKKIAEQLKQDLLIKLDLFKTTKINSEDTKIKEEINKLKVLGRI